MITGVVGQLTEVTELAAIVRLGGGTPPDPGVAMGFSRPGPLAVATSEGTPGVSLEVLIPAFLVPIMRERIGSPVTFLTHCYFEGVGQGASFVPKLLGFLTSQHRDFFFLLTSVSGIGNRKALRIMAQPPAAIAAWLLDGNIKGLRSLPEVGAKVAELMVAELKSKVGPFLSVDERGPDESGPAGAGQDAAGSPADRAGGGSARRAALAPTLPRSTRPPAVEQAIAALVSLGETRGDAERKIDLVLDRAGGGDRPPLDSVDAILASVFRQANG
ncbi:MAG: helix-hairpin-helix domain-containing protein [Planctomycetota bacterium]|nr:helix-hairpin-helix domain-containing protein [Planctomycetota bacterium]